MQRPAYRLNDGRPFHNDGLKISAQRRLDGVLPLRRYLHQRRQRPDDTIQISLEQRLNARAIGYPRIAHPAQRLLLAYQTSSLRTGFEQCPIHTLQPRATGAQLLLDPSTPPGRLLGLLLDARPLLLQVRQPFLALRQSASQLLDLGAGLDDLPGLRLLLIAQGFEFGQQFLTPGHQQPRPFLRHGQSALHFVSLGVQVGAFAVPIAQPETQFTLMLTQLSQSPT